ncbi:hypothetical protein [Aureliella helgolandensis]|uniref:Uncharacterized protein n=1 Tax=Aureliella helgolandensis TaxID=2527968 RepID=A0A518GE20_9BACT|nr:hypothetical protein [Aureliella helgolandensis]QDV26845.1 hypothetical protein Q31a_52240 [Aureliella helgolandensis]
METRSQLNETNPQTGSQPVGEKLTCDLHLDRVRAASWQILLAAQVRSGSTENSLLLQFAEQLEDACWLAHWKREDVVMSLDIAMVPELISQLLTIQSEQQGADQEIVADMLSKLAHR